MCSSKGFLFDPDPTEILANVVIGLARMANNKTCMSWLRVRSDPSSPFHTHTHAHPEKNWHTVSTLMKFCFFFPEKGFQRWHGGIFIADLIVKPSLLNNAKINPFWTRKNPFILCLWYSTYRNRQLLTLSEHFSAKGFSDNIPPLLWQGRIRFLYVCC